MLLATDLAEALVRADVPFREAHEAVGRIVQHCVAKQLDLRALSREDLRAFHPAFPAAARELVDLESALEGRALAGGTARARVEAALDAGRGRGARGARGARRRGCVMRRLAVAAALALATLAVLALACGRYGAPRRAERPRPDGGSRSADGPRGGPMTRLLEFTKMHGAGNDFIVLDGIRDALPPLEPLAARLCDRRFGIGADQLLVVRPSRTRRFPHADLQRRRLAGGDVRQRDPRLLPLPARARPHPRRRDPRRDPGRHRDAARPRGRAA